MRYTSLLKVEFAKLSEYRAKTAKMRAKTRLRISALSNHKSQL